MNLEQQDRNKR